MIKDYVISLLKSKEVLDNKAKEVAYLLNKTDKASFPIFDHINHVDIDPYQEVVKIGSADEHPIMGEYMSASFTFPLSYLTMKEEEILNEIKK